MKYLLVLLVVAIGLFVLFGRNRRTSAPPKADEPARPPAPATAPAPPAPMLACAHCGVHLPREDAMMDAAGRGYCGDAHRLAGPR
jgi:uncharacterized protein